MAKRLKINKMNLAQVNQAIQFSADNGDTGSAHYKRLHARKQRLQAEEQAQLDKHPNLTEAQASVLHAIKALGKATTSHIGESLDRSTSTIRAHIANLYKMGYVTKHEDAVPEYSAI